MTSETTSPDRDPRAEAPVPPPAGSCSSAPAGVPNSLCVLLGELGAAAVISVQDLAKTMGVCDATVKRMVARGELPPPVPMGRWQVWTVRWLIERIETRLEKAAEEAAILEKHSA